MVELTAIADCWANNFTENLDRNLNADGLGMGMWGGALNRSFLKFSLIGLSLDPNKLAKVELKLYGSRIHATAKARAYYTINSFSETTLTWRNQPPPTTLHWNGSGSLMGETGDIPGAASWYTILIDPVFVKHRWNQYFWVILRGTEAPESYCWAEDREAGVAYAPKIVLTMEEAPVGIPTTTTISAPSKSAVNEKFFISGILYETESGIPIPDQPINHSYNGRSLGGSTTGVDGDYLKEVSVPESGVWIIKSDFPGTPGYAASMSFTDAIIAASPLEAAIKIAGPAATGLALIIYGTG